MKKNAIQYLTMLCAVLLTSCNLFIDEDLENQLIEYNGKGYDNVVSEQGENFQVEYQYKKTTMELNADNPLTQHIVQVESVDSARYHVIHFDASTPVDLLPRVGQNIVSNNQDIFPFGLCDLVGVVEEVGGEHLVHCKGTDVADAFEKLKFHATFPVGDYLDEYDVYDDAGNFLAHIDNREENANARKTRGDEEADDYLKINIPFDIPWESDHLKEWLKQNAFNTDHFKVELTGGIKAKLYADCDFSFDDGLKMSFKLKDGSFDIGVKIEVSAGVGPKKLFGNDDLLNGKVRFTVGPVVVVPVFGFSVNFEVKGTLTTEVKYHKPFDFEFGFADGDFYSHNNSGDGTLTTSFEAACSFDFPVVKLSLGFGLFSSDLSIRAEIYAKLGTKVTLASGSAEYLRNDGKNPTDISFSPKLNCDFQLGIAVALVAKGMIIGKVIEKIKEHVKERSAFMGEMENYLKNGGYSEWVNLKNGATSLIDPKVLAAMEKELGGAKGEERDKLIDEWIKRKGEEVGNIKGLSDKAANTEMTGKVVDPGEANADKEYALRLGPFYPELLKWPLVDRYLFPKMKDGTFRMGRDWDYNKENLIWNAEYVLEDPGLMSIVRDYYPGFLIKLGSQEIIYMVANDGKKLSVKDKGKKITSEFKGLYQDYVYTCQPGYAVTGTDKATMWDKPITFSATTPSISIVDLKETKKERKDQYNEQGDPIGATYNYAFDTYSEVKGSRNVKEWGIIDLNDDNAKTRVHTSKSASLKSGQYVHHWSIKNTKKSKVLISLRPYVFAKDGDKTDWNDAKMFPIFNATIQDDFDFTSRPMQPAPEYLGFEATTVELDSVTYDGVRIL
ncbi:MAG: hypothetical protein IKQ05_04760 [Prevotella sp.]|nr:hypothetical protein [Prevotella sp.]